MGDTVHLLMLQCQLGSYTTHTAPAFVYDLIERLHLKVLDHHIQVVGEKLATTLESKQHLARLYRWQGTTKPP